MGLTCRARGGRHSTRTGHCNLGVDTKFTACCNEVLRLTPVKPLGPTDHQRRCYDLRHSVSPPMPWEDLAAEMGVKNGRQVEKLYYKARKNLRAEAEFVRQTDEHRSHHGSTESTRPELVAAIIDKITDPSPPPMAQVAREEGVPPELVMRLAKTLEKKYAKTKLVLREVKTHELLKVVESTAQHVLESITEEDIERANLRDKVASANVLIEKRQLLRGEPTQIYTSEDRRKLDDLVLTVVKEATRRGLSLDTTGDNTRVIDAEVVG